MFYVRSLRPIPPVVIEHMYDGEVKLIDGYVEIPDNKRHWVDRLLGLGYEECPQGGLTESDVLEPAAPVQVTKPVVPVQVIKPVNSENAFKIRRPR